MPDVPALAANDATVAQAPPSRLQELVRAYAQNRGALLGAAIVGLLIVLAIGADFIAPHPPNEQFRDFTLAPPAWYPDGSLRFVLGTDPVGGKEIVLKEGRFGPYVTDGETNASLRKGDDPETVTLDRAVELLTERRAKGPAKRGGRRRKAS